MGSVAAPIVLSGGEAAELVLGPDGRSLESVGFDNGDPRFGQLIEGDRGARPARGGSGFIGRCARADGVRFPFSIQRADRQFTPRPAESWIEVTPLLADKRAAPSKYFFYDTNYQPRTTVPVLDWLAGRLAGRREAGRGPRVVQVHEDQARLGRESRGGGQSGAEVGRWGGARRLAPA